MRETAGEPSAQADRWRDPAEIRKWIERSDREAADRRERFLTMAGLLPYEPTEPIKVLELGAGIGALGDALLEVFPRAELICTDLSPLMVAEGARRFAQRGAAVRYLEWDFSLPTLPAALQPPFDAVVSAQAIHFLAADQQQVLYRRIYGWLRPGGCFLNLEPLRAPGEAVFQRWQRAQDLLARQMAVSGHSGSSGQPPNVGTLDDLLAWLRAAGFEDVGCYWLRLDRAVVGGFRAGG